MGLLSLRARLLQCEQDMRGPLVLSGSPSTRPARSASTPAYSIRVSGWSPLLRKKSSTALLLDPCEINWSSREDGFCGSGDVWLQGGRCSWGETGGRAALVEVCCSLSEDEDALELWLSICRAVRERAFNDRRWTHLASSYAQCPSRVGWRRLAVAFLLF